MFVTHCFYKITMYCILHFCGLAREPNELARALEWSRAELLSAGSFVKRAEPSQLINEPSWLDIQPWVHICTVSNMCQLAKSVVVVVSNDSLICFN